MELTPLRATIDRIDGAFAVLVVEGNEKREYINYPASLPENIVKGDILDITIIRKETATTATRTRAASLVEKLKNKQAEFVVHTLLMGFKNRQ